MAPLSRRTFIEGSAAAALVGSPLTRALAAGSPDVVDVAGSDIDKMVNAAFDALGGIEKIVHPGDYVVLKPNASFANPPNWATTTHPLTVVAVAKACLKAKAKNVVIVEYPLAKGERAFARCGLTEAVAKVPGLRIRMLSNQREFKETKVKGAIALRSVAIAKSVLSADVLINIPAAKQHTNTGVSFGLKNAMGLIWDRRSFHTHLDIHQAVADLGRVIKPDLTLVDATRVLLTNGPYGPGETATPGRIIASRNVVSADAYALTVARFNNRQMTPDDAPHIKLAAAAGLGEADVGRLRIRKVSV